MKIGVFICHCGSNIAGTVDCGKVAEIAKTYPDVAFSTDTMYTCSEPGQEEIVAAIKEHKLDGVVVASCTPRMHEPTFRRTVERAGLNKYMFEMANIREHVSWIGKDKEANTNKAAELVRIAVEKLRRDNPLFSKSFESTKRVLVIGGGVAGIQAALDCADAGLDVLLVERESHIGGKMAKLDKTFPTVDCSSCILGPKMVDVAQHPKITLMAASEVTNVSGYVGNFTVTVKKKATYVDWSKCTGCGACMDKCPAKKTPDKFNEFVGPTTAINIPFPQAIPKKATINAEFCRKLTSGKCGVCAKVCPTGAINYEMKDEEVTETVGAIVAATGYDLMDWTVYGEYGAGQYPDVITSLQYERIMSASGPTGGHIKRPSDGKEPKSVVFIPDKFNEFVGPTTAINIPFPQAIPKKATINAEFCRKLTSGKCGVCAKVCPTGAINYEMKDEEVTETVGAIVAATGYDLMDWTVYGEYGAGQYPDVITSLQYERIMSASGPTGGHIKRPSDGKEPKSVVFIQCVGSRDKSIGRPYCSGFCCMYTAKQAVLTKDHIPDSQSYVFYMDIRSNAKLYDEFTRRAVEEYGTQYIRGRVSAIQPDGHGQYIVRGADTLLGKPVEVKADMVVLAVGIEGSKGANKLAETLHISYDGFGFFMESHCKLRPVETNTAGVFLAGVAQGPKDIPSSVAQGSGAAAKVIGLLSKPLLESDPQISVVDIKRCVGCGKCIKVCPFQAIVEKEIRGEKKAQTIEAVCQGCGLCTATCPQGAIQLSHFTDNQILAEVDALCRF